MAEYYRQRSGAGLIITEGTSPTPEGLGYPRIPGIFSSDQIAGWKKVTESVHQNGAKIFVQLMHTGRISNTYNLSPGLAPVGWSDIKAEGQIFTENHGMVDHTTPEELTTNKVEYLIKDHVVASKNAISAGFDGVELHAANGYLIEQSLNPHINTRTDEFGGSFQKRASFLIQIAAETVASIGKEKLGIRISPHSTFNDQPVYDQKEIYETYKYLASELNKIGVAYLHISVNPDIPSETLQMIRSTFEGTIIHCNGLTLESASEKIENGLADLTAFGSLYLANPDLDQRLFSDATFNVPDSETFFSNNEKGYTDYPFLK